MNWKTILQLMLVEMKSSRLLRGQKLTKYNVKRNRIYTYLGYIGAVIAGIVAGAITLYIYNLLSGDATFPLLFQVGFANFQYSLPTLILIVTFVFSMMQQLQRSGTSAQRQAPFWLPVTWTEHTLAAILADLLFLPMMAILLISPAVLMVAAATGQLVLALGAIIAMIGAAFMGSATTEIFRILQLRFTGAVYKSTGRAAVWVRFISSLLFFIIFYAIYFSITSGANALNFVQAIASAQSAIWFVPFVWPGLTLFSFMTGLWLQGAAFLFLSILFMLGLFIFGTALNTRFGLYEPPAIRVSRGVYAPKTGILGKLGLSAVEAALLRKDLKAFTRRRELMSAFIIPIVFIIIPIISSLNGTATPETDSTGLPDFMFALTSVFPAGLTAMSIGNFMTGEEGQGIWRIYLSPISARNFVKSKYVFMLFFSLLVLPITAAVGYFIYRPSIEIALTLVIEAVFIAFAAGALSLANGIKGADFNEIPRPRMIRTEWGLINMVTCFAVALAVLLPFLPVVISIFSGSGQMLIEIYQAVIISAAITVALTIIFYKMALTNANELLTRAEA